MPELSAVSVLEDLASAEDFLSRPRLRPRTWDPRPRTLLSRPRPLLFVLEATRGRGQVLEDTSPAIRRCTFHDPAFALLGTIPACDRQTDGRTRRSGSDHSLINDALDSASCNFKIKCTVYLTRGDIEYELRGKSSLSSRDLGLCLIECFLGPQEYLCHPTYCRPTAFSGVRYGNICHCRNRRHYRFQRCRIAA